ncbi:MAG: membrane protein insertion efficiency factor YidD [Alphaproteobacteria bacterium]|jgi:hypothetical protein
MRLIGAVIGGLLRIMALGLIRGYQLLISPLLGPGCRFAPSCSQYALEAVRRFGAVRGAWLALGRLLRCHPWGGSGFNPVPDRAHPTARGGRGARR